MDDRLVGISDAADEYPPETEEDESFRINDPDLARLERLTESDFVNGAPQFCSELIRHATDLGQKGDYVAATNCTKRALELFDQMDDGQRKRHRGDYAWALGLHGTLLNDAGRLEDGRSYLEAALAAYGEMDPVDPLLWDGRRAQVLHDMAIFFAKQQDFPEALRYAQGAVAAAGALGDNASEDLVAMRSSALVTQARLLRELGQPRDALAAAEEAAQGFTVIVARAPGTSVELTRIALELSESVDDMALPGLADVFDTLAVFYARGNRRDDASVFAERAVRLLRMLPQTGERRLRLAASLGNYASLLDQSGERRAAIERAREACALVEQCVVEGVAGAAPVLWQCVFNLALDLLNDGQAAEAHRVAEDALRRVDSSSADEASWAAQLREISAAASARENP